MYGHVRDGFAFGVAGEASNAVRRVLNDQGTRHASGVGNRERGRVVHHPKRVLDDHGAHSVGQAK